jgi:hypothetical protein
LDGQHWTSNPNVPDGTATFSNTGSTNVDNANGTISYIGQIAAALQDHGLKGHVTSRFYQVPDST